MCVKSSWERENAQEKTRRNTRVVDRMSSSRFWELYLCKIFVSNLCKNAYWQHDHFASIEQTNIGTGPSIHKGTSTSALIHFHDDDESNISEIFDCRRRGSGSTQKSIHYEIFTIATF